MAEAFGGHVKTLQSDRRRLQDALALGEELARKVDLAVRFFATPSAAL